MSRTIVHVGNANAVELQRFIDAQTGAEQTVFVAVPGERTTTIDLEDGLAFAEQLQQVIRFLQEMMEPTAKPWWFETDDDQLRTALYQHYGIPETMIKPSNWGDGTTATPPEEPKSIPGTHEGTDQSPEGRAS